MIYTNYILDTFDDKQLIDIALYLKFGVDENIPVVNDYTREYYNLENWAAWMPLFQEHGLNLIDKSIGVRGLYQASVFCEDDIDCFDKNPIRAIVSCLILVLQRDKEVTE